MSDRIEDLKFLMTMMVVTLGGSALAALVG
ncbi:hypothetical protein LKMONMHP_2189 [Methylobacterium organophilum]|uniref:Uncharacterized protein n=1 Tax=Methylobacterium organophilum TaxID=410 RepID=A0ABQ4T6Q6_METOR|nr:hypothetical protein LKMONMHP_2189 [Methylobacterium organophilum]